MKNVQFTISNVLLASTLAAGMFVAGSVSADTVGLAPAQSNAIVVASADFKGSHPREPHVVYEQHKRNGQFVGVEEKRVVPLADFGGKPPYKRHTVEQHLGMVQSAQLAESTGAAEHQHDIYRGSQATYPPYKRNW